MVPFIMLVVGAFSGVVLGFLVGAPFEARIMLAASLGVLAYLQVIKRAR